MTATMLKVAETSDVPPEDVTLSCFSVPRESVLPDSETCSAAMYMELELVTPRMSDTERPEQLDEIDEELVNPHVEAIWTRPEPSSK